MDVEAGRSTITDHTAFDSFFPLFLSRALLADSLLTPDSEYLHWYRRRVLEIMKKTLGAFPHTKIVWRSTHYPSDKNAKVRIA